MIADKDGGASTQAAARHIRRPLSVPSGGSEPVGPLDLDASLDAASRWLLDRQEPEGFWVGELEGDTILESEFVLLLAFLGREAEPVCTKLCGYIRDFQLPCGGWAIYPGGPAEVSASVKAYFALKIVGVAADDPVMVRARQAILELGGAQACNSFTRFYLALLGQIPYDDCPSVPPELVLIPSRLPFSLAAMSSWTRTIVVPLTMISAYKPIRTLPAQSCIDELFRADLPRRPSRRSAGLFSWTNFFLCVDRVLKSADHWVPSSWRRPGIRAAHRWMFDHFENSDGLGAIFPPMIYTVVALECLGYARDSAPAQWAMRQLEDLLIEEDGKVRVQPCVSPVWDTSIALIALSDAEVPEDHPALHRGGRWLLGKEVRSGGDWCVRRPGVEPSGWHFQFRNERYPDIDDTAMVLLALQRMDGSVEPDVAEVTRRALNWLMEMQNKDGGWAAFDVDIDNEVLTKVPFADHNAMLDPSCADITARVLEIMGTLGFRSTHPRVDKALDYLWRTQEPEGCWYGRWGVNYVYGTWQVLQGLKTLGLTATYPALRRAADWLESVQQPCGGWGESCASYDDRALMGRGEPSASQTAWALLGLISAGRADGESVARGVRFLVESQKPDGSWDEASFTGTGFPRVFYLRYHLYRLYFPLMALARYKSVTGQDPAATAVEAVAAPTPLRLRTVGN
jgi:squalene-hopene/tetraprenyl-beta-curcumene cyclase